MSGPANVVLLICAGVMCLTLAYLTIGSRSRAGATVALEVSR